VDYKWRDSRADLNGDGVVNFGDFAMFAGQWQPGPTAGDISFDGDPNNLEGNVSIRISGLSNKITQGFICVDGEVKGSINYMMGTEEANNCILLDTQELSNGQHSIKAVTIDTNGLITSSPTISVDTNNTLYYVTKGIYFEPNDGYHLYAMSDSPNNFRVQLIGWDGNNVWTSGNSVGGLNMAVPSDVLTRQLYDVVIEIEASEPPAWVTVHEWPIKNRRRGPGPYDVAIFLPNGKFKNGTATADCMKEAVWALVDWCELRNFNYIILYKGECTWNNFKEVLSYSSLKYVYMVAHGDNVFPPDPNYTHRVNRLWFVVSGAGTTDVEYVFSYRGGLPLGMDLSPRGHSMDELELYNWNYIRLVYMTVCNLGASDEMARKWLHYIEDVAPVGQLFCGWDGKPQGLDRYWQKWDYDFWHHFGQGGVTASDAFKHAKSNNWAISLLFRMIGSIQSQQVTFDH
jgi:hypothetical protein